MPTVDRELFTEHIKKSYRVFTAAVCLISFLELLLTIRGLMIFDLSRPKHRLYLYSYLFLLITSLITFLVLCIARGKERRMTAVIVQSHLYAFALMGWSTFVSMIDIVAKGDSGPIVLVMTSFAIGAIFMIKPIYYVTMLSACSTALLMLTFLGTGVPLSVGFYINYTVFYVLSLFLNVHIYRLNLRKYQAVCQLQTLAITDQLTGLYNRRHLDEQVFSHVQAKESFHFMLIDADGFKQINDSHGHAVGDRCLCLIADELRAAFNDQVYRFGGDEFAIISTAREEDIIAAIDAVNTALPRITEDIDLHISVGIYRATPEDSADSIFIRTDRALYAAKHAGKARWVIYGDKEASI